jgi:TDG/mug DNA glycosylase family protein
MYGMVRRLSDRIRPGIQVLFVGINPGLRSAAVGHHFAGFSNRFWKLLYDSGLVAKRISCEDDVSLPDWGYGITNLVPRASAGIGELRREEYEAGCERLMRKVRAYRPLVVALVGVTLFRVLFPASKSGAVSLGLQPETLGGAAVFVLPNPSGRNAHYSYPQMLQAFRGVKQYLATTTSA